ncbi:hypothetical protein B1A_07358, partial [mine drainage metagenome]
AYAIPSSQLYFENVSAVPYLLYNFSTPATVSDVNGRTRYLNESYDVYSPHNYLNPNSLEPYGLHTGSGFFATITNSSGSYFAEFPYSEATTPSNTTFSNPNPNFVLPSHPASRASNPTGTSSVGLPILSDPNILSNPNNLFQSKKIMFPIFATATPNDYLYIINTTINS